MFTEHLHNSQGHVGRGHARVEVADQSDTYNIGCEHVDWLPQHDSFCFNAADAPSKNTQTVDHGGVGIRSDKCVCEPNTFFLASNACQILQVDLVNNTTRRWDCLEVGQRLLTPLQERVPFHVSMVFDVEVHVQCLAVCAVDIDLNGVIDYQIDRNLWVDLFWVTTHFDHCVTKRCKVNNGWNTGEILENDSRWTEWNFTTLTMGCPSSNVSDVAFAHEEAVVSTECPLQEDPNRVRERCSVDALFIESCECIVIAANRKRSSCIEWVQGRHD